MANVGTSRSTVMSHILSTKKQPNIIPRHPHDDRASLVGDLSPGATLSGEADRFGSMANHRLSEIYLNTAQKQPTTRVDNAFPVLCPRPPTAANVLQPALAKATSAAIHHSYNVGGAKTKHRRHSYAASEACNIDLRGYDTDKSSRARQRSRTLNGTLSKEQWLPPTRPLLWDLRSLQVKLLLGTFASSILLQAETPTGTAITIKAFLRQYRHEAAVLASTQFHNEYSFLTTLAPCAGVAKLLGWGCREGQHALILESLNGGSLGLAAQISNRHFVADHMRLLTKLSWLKQIFETVAYLHSKGIVHNALRIEDFMFRHNKHFATRNSLALTNFCEARHMRPHIDRRSRLSSTTANVSKTPPEFKLHVYCHCNSENVPNQHLSEEEMQDTSSVLYHLGEHCPAYHHLPPSRMLLPRIDERGPLEDIFKDAASPPIGVNPNMPSPFAGCNAVADIEDLYDSDCLPYMAPELVCHSPEIFMSSLGGFGCGSSTSSCKCRGMRLMSLSSDSTAASSTVGSFDDDTPVFYEDVMGGRHSASDASSRLPPRTSPVLPRSCRKYTNLTAAATDAPFQEMHCYNFASTEDAFSLHLDKRQDNNASLTACACCGHPCLSLDKSSLAIKSVTQDNTCRCPLCECNMGRGDVWTMGCIMLQVLGGTEEYTPFLGWAKSDILHQLLVKKESLEVPHDLMDSDFDDLQSYLDYKAVLLHNPRSRDSDTSCKTASHSFLPRCVSPCDPLTSDASHRIRRTITDDPLVYIPISPLQGSSTTPSFDFGNFKRSDSMASPTFAFSCTHRLSDLRMMPSSPPNEARRQWAAIALKIKSSLLSLIHQCLQLDPTKRPNARHASEMISNLYTEVRQFYMQYVCEDEPFEGI